MKKLVLSAVAILTALVSMAAGLLLVGSFAFQLSEASDFSSSLARINRQWNPFHTPPAYDQYEFSAQWYPYYAMLTPEQQTVYRQLYENALSCGASVTPDAKITAEDLPTIYNSLLDDHPELFWLETSYQYAYFPDGRVTSITMLYNDTSGNLERNQAAFEAAADEILSGLDELSLIEQERAVHDRMIQQISYDESEALNQSAYSALVGKVSVCAGFSRAFQYLMQKLGIPCYYCTGISGGDHAWNIVQLGSDYYHVDVLWDSTQSNGQKYRYFNLTDEEISVNHIRTDLSLQLPACEGPSLMVQADLPPEAEHRYGGRVFRSLEEYDEAMGNILASNGAGTYLVTLTLENEQLYDEIFTFVNSGNYQKKFLQRALEKLNLKSYRWEMSISGELRNEGRIAIQHQISLTV